MTDDSGPLIRHYHDLPTADFNVQQWTEAAGKQALKKCANDETREEWLRTLRGVFAKIPARTTLAALATETAGGSHGLDYNVSPLSRWVVKALASWQGVTVPKNRQDWRLVWSRAGVDCDRLSSTVLVAGIIPAGDTSPVERKLRASLNDGAPCVLTLYELRKWPIDLGGQTIFGVENPAVVEEALERLGSTIPPIACVYGYGSVASLSFLGGSLELKYHGDFDWDGLRIAHRLEVLLGGRFVPWRYDRGEYDEATKLRKHAKELDIEKAPADVGIFTDLRDAMKERRAVVYEEDVLTLLLEDLERDAEERSYLESEIAAREGL